jgi:hypothetical protein
MLTSCYFNSSLDIPAVPAAEGMTKLTRHVKSRREREMGETWLHIHPTPRLLASALALVLLL